MYSMAAPTGFEVAGNRNTWRRNLSISVQWQYGSMIFVYIHLIFSIFCIWIFTERITCFQDGFTWNGKKIFRYEQPLHGIILWEKRFDAEKWVVLSIRNSIRWEQHWIQYNRFHFQVHKAYKTLSRILHPDHTDGSKHATEKFKVLSKVHDGWKGPETIW